MTINLATQLASILRAEPDLAVVLGPLAARPLDQVTGAEIRRIAERASPAVRFAFQRQTHRTSIDKRGIPGRSQCGPNHKRLVSEPGMAIRSQGGA